MNQFIKLQEYNPNKVLDSHTDIYINPQHISAIRLWRRDIDYPDGAIIHTLSPSDNDKGTRAAGGARYGRFLVIEDPEDVIKAIKSPQKEEETQPTHTIKNETYNGWTNYATWRVNLELFPDDLQLDNAVDQNDVEQMAEEALFASSTEENQLMESYAMAFLQDVNWYEIAAHLNEQFEE